MNETEFPSGLQEKLPLDKPQLWDINAFKSRKRMPVSRGNTALKNVFAEAETLLPRLVASVRWSILRRPYRDFALASGLSPNGYKPMEKDTPSGSPVHRSKYTRLLRYWSDSGVSVGVREQLLDLLTNPDLLQLDGKCKDLLSAIEYMRKQSLHLLGVEEMNAFYHRIGYDCGHGAVEKRFPSFYNAIWQREKTRTVPDCLEVLRVVGTMYRGRSEEVRRMRALRRAQGIAVWSEAQSNQYLERMIEEPLANFLVMLERDLASEHGVTLTSLNLRDHYGFSPLHAEQLTQLELIEGEAIEDIVRRLMPKKEVPAFLQQWNAACDIERKRQSFGTLGKAAMEERGYTAADLAQLLGVQAPEERGKAGKSDRSQRYRPDGEVRDVLFRNHVSRQISVGALIKVIARDDAHADELREAYFRHRERFFRRNGSSLRGDGLRMRILRELANVGMNDLARCFLPKRKHRDRVSVREKNKELQRLERDEGKAHRIRYADVFHILEGIADERSEEALVRVQQLGEMHEVLKQFTSVQQMARNLIAGMKGANRVSEMMRDIARNDSEWLRADVITDIAEGNYVCALPQLRAMAKGTLDVSLPLEVVRDWYERFPLQLMKGAMNFGTVTRILPRVLCTLIASREAEPIRFYKDRVPGIVPTLGTKYMRQLEAGESVEWRHLHKTLLGTGQGPQDIPYLLVRGLYENDGDLDKVLPKLLHNTDGELEIHPMTFRGVTLDELRHFIAPSSASAPGGKPRVRDRGRGK